MRRWTDVTRQSSLTVMNLAVRPSPPDMCFLAVGLSQDLSSLYVQSTLAYLLRFLVMPDTANICLLPPGEFNGMISELLPSLSIQKV